MEYKDEDIRSYCGNCKKTYPAEVYYCPECGSNLVNYNSVMPTEKYIIDDRWERHNRGFRRERNGTNEKLKQ